MRRYLPVLAIPLMWACSAAAAGLLVPEEKTVPPLAMLDQRVTVTIEDQVSMTRIEETFRNHTDRALEATYLFPVPRGASVREFTMSVNGQQTKAELLEAAKATQIYTDIVRRTMDPGLLEYIGGNLMRMRIFPVPPRGDVKVSVSYTAVAGRDGSAVEYIYPLKSSGKATRTLGKFSMQVEIKSQHRVQNVYSPSHAIDIKRPSDHEATVTFERKQAFLVRDFQLFYDVGDKDVGLTALTHRPIADDNGYVQLLVSPRIELAPEQVIPRDMVLVLDTSGSMRGTKMDQARRALKYCLDNLGRNDRFSLINFATTVNSYTDHLLPSSRDQIEQAKKWVDQLEASGGTAIDDALRSALELRSKDESRTFTIVFFTDGCPTIGETDPQTILKNVAARNTAYTRIFTFGVGDDVNATMLDELAEHSRAVSTYVRPAEDIEAKVSSLYTKISNPVLANLKLTLSGNVRLSELYPPQLPDLFHGGQLVVLGRYSGYGHAAIHLSGHVGSQQREFVYEMSFPRKTKDDHAFVEHLWGHRKVGYLLDQIRAHGEKKELVDEVVRLAKRYGIATPYTSYLVAPDMPVPLASLPPGGGVTGAPIGPYSANGRGGFEGGFGGYSGGAGGLVPPALRTPDSGAGAPQTVMTFAKGAGRTENLARLRDRYLSEAEVQNKAVDKDVREALKQAKEKRRVYDEAFSALRKQDRDGVQSGRLGVDLSIDANRLRSETRLRAAAQRRVAGRTCIDVGGVWIDDGFDAKAPVITVKAMSDAYFKILGLHPEMKEVYQLGNYLLWITPSGTALIVDANDGKSNLSDAEIDKLFVARK